MDLTIAQQVLLYGFLIAVVMGAVVNKTNFCTMGAVSDWVNMGDTSRMRAWFLAISVAMIGAILLETLGVLAMDSTLPPYRATNFAWPRYIFGGLMFGVGMTLASGCGNKTLIRIGGGNLKSIVVLLVAGFFAYLMTKTNFYAVVFHSWMNPISVDLGVRGYTGQDIGSLAAHVTGGDAASIRLIFGMLLAGLMLFIIFRSEEFRKGFDHVLAGIVVGAAVIGAWYITGGPMGQTWLEEVEFMDQRPISVGVQSYTFINPMGEALAYVKGGADSLLVSFGLTALLGVIVGSFLYSIFTKKFRIEWFSSKQDVVNHLIGATLMGIGGVLSMGCTIGQGITGVSTLAIGSMMVLVSIILGSALTMKVQYYKMVYEDEATFAKSLITGLVDMKLLPEKLRKLDAV